jgi:carboxylesterase type B
LPQWSRYDLKQRATLIFNAESQHVEQDPQGQERQLWENAG